jgi:Zn finger protein HypA/HybF involved in hydrogenase expression
LNCKGETVREWKNAVLVKDILGRESSVGLLSATGEEYSNGRYNIVAAFVNLGQLALLLEEVESLKCEKCGWEGLKEDAKEDIMSTETKHVYRRGFFCPECGGAVYTHLCKGKGEEDEI